MTITRDSGYKPDLNGFSTADIFQRMNAGIKNLVTILQTDRSIVKIIEQTQSISGEFDKLEASITATNKNITNITNAKIKIDETTKAEHLVNTQETIDKRSAHYALTTAVESLKKEMAECNKAIVSASLPPAELVKKLQELKSKIPDIKAKVDALFKEQEILIKKTADIGKRMETTAGGAMLAVEKPKMTI